ncbi:hypothetical protein EKP73_23675 [Salmonella enterica subsp. enterica serovar Typhimurium]|nr:hypothetical protein [Salmonella enterica subsp. enterica serovar Litchfield]ECA4274507.1 hypothetical protein [Salmonella enterica subsp. enterica serovar Typhimurium]ECD2929304.1 hypothetical protein [Salmonella enterica subsp. enterica serovar Napoli]
MQYRNGDNLKAIAVDAKSIRYASLLRQIMRLTYKIFRIPNCPRYFIRTPYNGVLASQTRHDYCPQSSMIRGVMSPGLVGRW